MRTLPILLAIFFAFFVAAPAAAQNTVSRNLIDGVQIFKITPRSNAELPLPMSGFVVNYELKVLMKSTPNGTLEVGFYRWTPRGQSPLVPLVVRPVDPAPLTKGRHVVVLASAPLNVPSAANDEKLLVRAVLKDARGKEVAYCESYNPFRGRVVVRPSGASAQSDSIDVLGSSTPSAGTDLKVGTNVTFVLRLNYNVRSARRAWLNVELGEVTEVRNGAVWTSSVVQLPAGTGQVEIQRSFYLPNFLVGRTMAIGLPLRLDALGGSVQLLEIKPYPIVP